MTFERVSIKDRNDVSPILASIIIISGLVRNDGWKDETWLEGSMLSSPYAIGIVTAWLQNLCGSILFCSCNSKYHIAKYLHRINKNINLTIISVIFILRRSNNYLQNNVLSFIS